MNESKENIREKMLAKIDEEHDWLKGRKYSTGGTEIHSTDICQICGLRRHFKEDRQNFVEAHYRFSDGETGEDLSMKQAYLRKCFDPDEKSD